MIPWPRHPASTSRTLLRQVVAPGLRFLRCKADTIGAKLSDMRQQDGHATATGKALEQSPKAKKPYRKPSFRRERVFETMA